MRNGHTRVADYIISSLAELGVDHVFGVGGANIEDMYDAVHHGDGRVKAVVAKHEFSATCMAEGSHRTVGGLGVVMATSGAGAMNLVPGVAEAYAARVPLLALVGQPPRDLEGRGAFQDTSGRSGAFNAVELFGSISRFCARVDDPADTGKLLAAAVDAARSPRGGPAVLLLPKDVQQAAAGALRPLDELLTPTTVPAAAHRQAAADLLADAARGGSGIVLIAGDGVGHQDARAELAALADRLGASVAVTPDGKDAFDNREPRYVGVAGAIGHPTVRRQLEEAAVCVLVGTRLPVMARAGLDGVLADTPLICFDPEPPFIGPQPDGPPVVHVDGDLRAELRAVSDLLPVLPARPAPARGPEYLVTPRPDSPGVRLSDAVEAIGSALPDDAPVVSDAGNASSAAVHYLTAPHRGKFIIAMGMGGMGHSFGTGIGAAFATGRRTYVLAGDGGFYAHGMEIHTAVEYDLPVTFIIFNNNAHAMCVTREQLFYEADYSFNTFKPSSIAAGAGAMFPSLNAVRATTAGELRTALTETNSTPGPALVCVEADPAEMPPFVPFLRQLESLTTPSGATHVDYVTPVG
ncbi:thiamine pyrophosphate-binding protein [Streptomyces sp. NBC_01387]|uniref:thiamine pyrophosphate-binding protein n=1 Tax=unclassified Streptomyces TaxID=2593676 RepID=UPI00202572DE|nr:MULTISPECIES: thiamine pyrophosphate-binding protein [unclassified Streptomyces]MCX4547602.1 thiamine pyrophosphate-binding protein [Streptomyces sp. NBC_01500]WSC19288.1 thiamine pyrophosphate-binding protein [Streptomyces sp. NBC_01766]WSV53311.1 thiamine pyrophosphate-binding protein [Streptomyces sp. NBC_01014]